MDWICIAGIVSLCLHVIQVSLGVFLLWLGLRAPEEPSDVQIILKEYDELSVEYEEIN